MYKLTDQGVSAVSVEGFTLFIPEDVNNSDWLAYLEWLEAGNTPEPQFTDQEIAEKEIRMATDREALWRSEEMKAIADQLLAIEDSDPSRLPGTEGEWREYRVKVRAWAQGTEGFPDLTNRPRSPGQHTN